jgi:cytochrome P450
MAETSMRLLNGPPKMSPWRQRLRAVRWIFRPLDVLDTRFQLYGDNFRVSSPDRQPALLYFSSPDALEALFTAKPEQISAGSGNAILKPLLGEHGVVLLEGTAHQRQRQLLMPPFHGDRMRSYGEVIQAITQQRNELPRRKRTGYQNQKRASCSSLCNWR